MTVASSIRRYGLALAACGAATILTWLSGESSCLLAAVAAAGLQGGRGPGLVAVAVGGAALAVFLLVPGWRLPTDSNDLVRLAVFLAVAIVVCLLIEDRWSTERTRRAERETRLIVESMPGLGWSTDAAGRFRYFNRAVFDYTGTRVAPDNPNDEDDFAGKSLLHPDEADRVVETWRHCLETGAAYESEHRLRGQDGAYRWFRAVARPERDRNGRVTGWYGTTLDIDDHKKAEEALRRSEQQLKLLIDTMPALVWCATPAGDAFYLNKRLLDYVGLPPEEASRSRFKIIHPDDIPTLIQTWERTIKAGGSFRITYRLRRADGVFRWHEGRAEPFRDQAGRVVQWYGVNVDIEDRMNAEHALRSAQTAFQRASQLASLAELSASIAHEVNQPLAAVITNSHACQRWLAASPPNIERARITTERIIRDANAAAEVVSRIRALFRQKALARTHVNVNDLIAETLQFMADEMMARNVCVETVLEPDLPPILIDRIQMQQVLVNLIRNGIDAMDRVDGSGRLVIRSRREGQDRVLVEVQDYGSGVADTERIFEPFFTTKEDGMGMGLAICRSIVEAHDGRLWATKGDPKGTALAFTLPLHPVPHPVAAA